MCSSTYFATMYKKEIKKTVIMKQHQKIFFIITNHKKQILVALFFIVSILFFIRTGITTYFTLEYLQKNVHNLQMHIQEHYFESIGIYLLSYISASALSIPGSTFFLTASGFLFGTVIGFFLSLIGATIGAALLFFTSRYMIGSWVQHYFREKLIRFNKEITNHGFYYLLMVRLIGLLPFCMVNLLSGITLIRPFTFLWTTCIGMIPFALVYTFVGAQLSHLETISYANSPSILIVLALFYSFKITLVPLFYKKIKQRRAKIRAGTIKE